MKSKDKFKADLTSLINKHCIENESNTPDFIIADYLVESLENYNKINAAKEKWYGGKLEINGGGKDGNYTSLRIIKEDETNQSGVS